jgi:hypothetical protein
MIPIPVTVTENGNGKIKQLSAQMAQSFAKKWPGFVSTNTLRRMLGTEGPCLLFILLKIY